MRRETSPEEEALEELRRLKEREPSGRKKRTPWVRYIAVVLLAVACIGGAELTACRFFAPALYEDLMEPVRETGRQTAQAAGRVLEAAAEAGTAAAGKAGEAAAALALRAGEAREALRDWMEELTAPPPEAEPLEDGDSALAQPEIAPPKDILDPLISDIILREGQEVLTGGGLDVTYFNQTDELRAEQRYGSDPLATHGCGPTALAMAVSSLTGETVDPADMAAFCVDRGYWCRGHGSYLSIVQGVAESWELDCEPLDPESLEADEIYRRLAAGDVAVALMTKGHFTKGGHFILLRGTTLSGEILVADPASRDRSLIPWDLSLILEELSPSRHDGAPLWMLSKPAD
ncbi:C39 family peptidase [Oscillibacter sp.]|uniref:C39 family peptidase n=1 Tax=Oscillibacter sp. TaxID=1945593 RepID=UPI002D7EA5DB|nr:C39 family peptidase [Oscillibacter sp.]